MQTTSQAVHRSLAIFFVFTLLLQVPLNAVAQRPWSTPGPVDISIGRPSIWTLAQAHYLLAQMHKDDRGLKLKTLTDLDPNATNRQRIEVLQTLLGVTGEFDQTAGATNRVLQQRFDTHSARQQTVQSELDRRNNDLIQTDRDLYFLTVDLNRLKGATPPDADAIKAKTAEQDAKNVEKSAIQDRISALNSEATRLQTENVNNNLPGFTGPFSGPQATPSPLANKLNDLIDKNFLNSLYADSAKSSSALQASMQLDNYIQGQYELIAKQLTLLRDEVGPNERVVFLELPSAIYSVPKKGDEYVAQVRWQVTRYCRESAEESEQSETAEEPEEVREGRRASPSDSSRWPQEATRDPYYQNVLTLADELGLRTQPPPRPAPTPDANCWQNATPNEVRTVDIVPRQSALNVNSIHETSNGLAIAARFMSIFGFGAKVDYQRQRDIYDQFVYQDIFASGFGKGSNLFGWTFGALPGTKSLAPGVRTTFAVVVIPASARSIEIAGSGYSFRRSQPQPAVNQQPDAIDTFRLDVPGEDTNAFWVKTADYATVQAGKRVSLVLGGPYFSPQVGVLINGIPLERAVAIAPIDPPSNSGTGNTNNSGVTGQYEYVNSRRLIASFSMGNDYEGTPVISLVTPDKTSIINRYHIDVNHNHWQLDSLAMHALLEPMFLMPLAITKIEFINRWIDANGNLKARAVISGRGFRPRASISINGVRIDGQVFQRSTHQYDITFSPPAAPSWDFTIRQNTTQGQEEVVFSLNRPLAPQVTYDILRYAPQKEKAQAQMDLRVSSSGFQSISSVQLLQDGVLMPEWPCVRNAALPIPPAPTRSRRSKKAPETTRGTCSVVGGGDVLVSLRFPKKSNNESLIFIVTGDRGEATVLNILPPALPTITSIVNDATKKGEGSPDGGYSVVIHGENLEQVDRVFFGKKAAVIQQSSAGVITVQVPKSDEGPVRVVLETNTVYRNKFLSNSEDFADPAETRAIFTYVKPKA